MRWVQIEYILKGIYLGLLVFVALQEPPFSAIERVIWLTLGGLVLCLGISAVDKLRQGYNVRGRVPAFILFLLLESPELVYTGLLLGMAAGAITVDRKPDLPEWLLSATVAGGALLGLAFSFVPFIRDRWHRFGLILGIGAALGGAALYFLPDILVDPKMFGLTLMVGMLVFYLLAFAGRAKETEIEIGAICASLGVGLYFVRLTPNFQSIVFLVPLGIFYWYTTRVLPNLRVFKHAMRGLSYARVGQYRQALLTLQRAIELNPEYKLAREGLWSVHKAIDWPEVAKDPEMVALVNFNLCLERASSLLAVPPTPAQREEAARLLDLTLQHRPRSRPVVQYWRAVSHIHTREHDQAAEELASVLDPTDYDADDPQRWSVLLPAWQVALRSVGEIRKRVGDPQLAVPGRRMEAIAAVERHLAHHPADSAAWDLKRLLYSELTLEEYQTTRPRAFDHGQALELGQALIADPQRWQRGAEFLQIAARGLPDRAPVLFVQVAQASEKAKDSDSAWQFYELAQKAGQAIGPKNLPDESRQAYFVAVKYLAETAAAKGDVQTAIDNYHLYTEYERSGVETLRTLTSLYEKRYDKTANDFDILACVRLVEHALIFDGKDKDLLARKDKYYFSLKPEYLKEKLESVKSLFDVTYCLTKARSILDSKNIPPDDFPHMMDWALHLAKLASVHSPASITARLLQARAHQAIGEKDEALRLLEDVWCAGRPAKFASGEDEDSWFAVCQRLGTMYLRELTRPELAIPCLNEFRKGPRSGADTLFKLGEAYEQTGDAKRAINCFEQVTTYESHPLAGEAREAIYRLQAKQGASETP